MSFRIHPEPAVSLLPLIKAHHPIQIIKEENKPSMSVPAIIEPEQARVLEVVNESSESSESVLHQPIGEEQDVVFRIKRRTGAPNSKPGK